MNAGGRIVAFALAASLGGSSLARPAFASPGPGDALLQRARVVFRAHPRPPFVVYTLVRRDTIDGAPDFANSYTLRVWCRTADRASLSRMTDLRGRPRGPMVFLRPGFDQRLDPGPPVADVFDPALYVEDFPAKRTGATPVPEAPSNLPEIGRVVVSIETSYRVTRVGRDGGDDDLLLEPLRDGPGSRIREMWLDPNSGELKRMVVADHLYRGLETIPERFDVTFGDTKDGIPIIARIHGQTDMRAMGMNHGAPLHEVDYTFRDISFPSTLPDWYFHPEQYGAHRADAPE